MARRDSLTPNDSESVAVAVHIRPLIEQEVEQGCSECIHVPSPGRAEVITGPHSFAYDHVFGGCGKESALLYDECVAPLVDGLFSGYNATVFAYGQTGSGKTYTMGSAFPQTCAEQERGVIPKAMDAIFDRIASMRDSKEFTIKVGFVEIHKEEIKDLLAVRTSSTPPVHIREVPGGGIMLAGANEIEVTNQSEMIAVLEQGTCLRATGATGMNQRSSRSHAIFTISVEQRSLAAEARNGVSSGKSSRKNSDDTERNDSDESDDDTEAADVDVDDEYLCAKMHLVDLAGSERAKRTKTEGQRMQEGIKINKGLLALGNVINALSENKQHVPYRDSKLTRMLQDSLGGNSRTLMIACVSPADVNMEESLNSLRYASRARAIKNKPVVNRDPVAAQIASLRQQLALARAENADLRRKLGLSPTENLQDKQSLDDLKLTLESTRTQLAQLSRDLGLARKANEELKKDLQEQAEERILACMQRDKMAQALASKVGETEAEATIAAIGATIDSESVESTLLKKVQELEEENRNLRFGRGSGSPMHIGRGGSSPLAHRATGSPGSGSPFGPASSMSPFSNVGDTEADDLDEESISRKQVIDSMNEQMDKLQLDLEAKEAAIRKVSNHASMQVAYTSHLQEIQKERDSLAKERRVLLSKIKDLQSASAEERMQLERMYKCKLRELDQKVKAAEKREQKIRGLEATQRKAAQKVKELEGEVQSIKVQKAQLLRQAEKAGKEYVQWKRSRDRELQKLKRENQATEVKLLKMEAQSSRQQAYLRRKIEEAAAARKRLANLEGRRHAARTSKSIKDGASAGNRETPPLTNVRRNVANRTPEVVDLASEGGLEEPARPSAGDPSRLPVDGAQQRACPLPSDLSEWVEGELDSCCSSIELQKVLEGEKAARSQVASELRQVEKKLAALKNPKWWGVPSPGANKDQKTLEQRKRELMKEAEAHGREIQEAQLLLMQSRAAEEEKGQGAADPARWEIISNIGDAQKVLVQLFMVASRHKRQAYESASAISEMSEEMDMLRLKLEVAEAERLEQQMQLDELRAAMDALETAAVKRSLTPASVSRSRHNITSITEDSDVKEVLHELDSIAVCEDDDDDDDDEEYASANASVCDLSEATSAVSRLSGVSSDSRINSPSTSVTNSRISSAVSDDSSQPGKHMGQVLLPGEIAVLGHMNSIRASTGLSPVYALTTRDLISRLEQVPDWHDGSKFSDPSACSGYSTGIGVESANGVGEENITGNTTRIQAKGNKKSKAELIADYLVLVAGQDPPTRGLQGRNGLQTILSSRSTTISAFNAVTKSPNSSGTLPKSDSKIKSDCRRISSPSVVRTIDLTQAETPASNSPNNAITRSDVRTYVSRSNDKARDAKAKGDKAPKRKVWIPAS